MNDLLKFQIALSQINGIGGVLARNLVAYVGDVEGVFAQTKKALMKIPGIGEYHANLIKNADTFSRAENELEFIEKNNIQTAFYTEEHFPRRLKPCPDAPILLYSKGNVSFNNTHVLSIVGTRNATNYGKQLVDDLMAAFKERNLHVLIVSGLAYGIDIHAHKAAVKNDLPTVGILAHGLDILYPALHKSVAKEMCENGGLACDFPSETKIDPQNFLKRNRIIAGLADATLVVESAEKGGSLVTADIASSYNRDVFTFPGRVGDTYSKGCNQLIKNNGATLIQGIDDLEYFMGWEAAPEQKEVQASLFVELNEQEQTIVNLLKKEGELFIDQISAQLNLPVSKVSTQLLNLEFKNVLIALPGKVYKLR